MARFAHTVGLVFLLGIAHSLMGCDNHSSSPEEPTILLTVGNLGDFSVQVAGFADVSFEHELGHTVLTKVVNKLVLGYEDSSGFHGLDSVQSVPSDIPGYSQLSFFSIVHLDASWISPMLLLKYFLTDQSVVVFSRQVDLYKYKYGSTIFVMDMSKIDEQISPYIPRPQDVTRWADVIYVHSFASYGTWSFDLDTHIATKIIHGGGDFLASDSGYVFRDYSSMIYRFNTNSQTIDLEIPAPFGPRSGIDASEGVLYVQVRDTLWEISYSGEALRHRPFILQGYYITVAGGTIYARGHQGDLIRRYDLSTLTELPSLESPPTEGIKIVDDMLYYCNYTKRAIFAVPVDSLRLSDES